jgi:hypothetical protein
MKLLFNAIIVFTLSTGAAYAQGGNVGGAESRGQPINSGYRAAAVDRTTGYTPGHSVKKRHTKKTRTHRSTSGSSAVGH